MYTFCVVYYCIVMFFFFKQKTAYEMRISDWSSDVCSSDLSRHGVSAFQPVSPFDGTRKLHGRASPCKEKIHQRGRRTGNDIPHPRQDSGTGREISRAALRRTKTAGGHREKPQPVAQNHAVRRATPRTGAGNGQRGTCTK